MNKTLLSNKRVVVIPDQQPTIPMFVVAHQSGVDNNSEGLHRHHLKLGHCPIIATFHGDSGGLIMATRLYERQLVLSSGDMCVGYFERYNACYASVRTDSFAAHLKKVSVDMESFTGEPDIKQGLAIIDMWQIVVDTDSEKQA